LKLTDLGTYQPSNQWGKVRILGKVSLLLNGEDSEEKVDLSAVTGSFTCEPSLLSLLSLLEAGQRLQTKFLIASKRGIFEIVGSEVLVSNLIHFFDKSVISSADLHCEVAVLDSAENIREQALSPVIAIVEEAENDGESINADVDGLGGIDSYKTSFSTK